MHTLTHIVSLYKNKFCHKTFVRNNELKNDPEKYNNAQGIKYSAELYTASIIGKVLLVWYMVRKVLVVLEEHQIQ